VIVLAAVILAAALIGAVLLMRPPAPRDRLLRERLCDKVVVTLKTGAAFGGVLFEADDRVVILRTAHALEVARPGDNVVVDGELVLFRSDIEYLQRP
jgi:hypothetical protein